MYERRTDKIFVVFTLRRRLPYGTGPEELGSMVAVGVVTYSAVSLLEEFEIGALKKNCKTPASGSFALVGPVFYGCTRFLGSNILDKVVVVCTQVVVT
jgi:hypothetical protein